MTKAAKSNTIADKITSGAFTFPVIQLLLLDNIDDTGLITKAGLLLAVSEKRDTKEFVNLISSYGYQSPFDLAKLLTVPIILPEYYSPIDVISSYGLSIIKKKTDKQMQNVVDLFVAISEIPRIISQLEHLPRELYSDEFWHTLYTSCYAEFLMILDFFMSRTLAVLDDQKHKDKVMEALDRFFMSDKDMHNKVRGYLYATIYKPLFIQKIKDYIAANKLKVGKIETEDRIPNFLWLIKQILIKGDTSLTIDQRIQAEI